MSWFESKNRVTSTTPRPRSATLSVQQLEPRDLLSAATMAVASGIVNSTESLTDFVAGEYKTFLGRAPDTGGLQSCVNQLQNGVTPETVEAGIVSSTEYLANHGHNRVSSPPQ